MRNRVGAYKAWSSREAYETAGAASGAKTWNEIGVPLVRAFCTASITFNSTGTFWAATQLVSAPLEEGRLSHVSVLSPQPLSATTARVFVAVPDGILGVRRRRAASTRP